MAINPICDAGLSFSASISVVVQAMTAWFAPLNRRDFKFSFAVLLLKFAAQVACSIRSNLLHISIERYKIHARWWKKVPQP